MNYDEIKIKVISIVKDVMGLSDKEITEDDSPDSIDEWDSLTHLNMVVALEGEFGVSLSPEEIMDMQSVRIACLTIEEHLKV